MLVLTNLFCNRRVLRFLAPGKFSVIRSLLFFVFLLLVTVFLRYPGFRFLRFFVSFDEFESSTCLSFFPEGFPRRTSDRTSGAIFSRGVDYVRGGNALQIFQIFSR